MPTYEEIRNELKGIAEILSLYPETLQTKVFDILVSQYLKVDINTVETLSTTDGDKCVTEEIVVIKEKQQPIATKQSVKKRNISKQSYQIIKDINFRSENGKPSLSEFCITKKPKSNIEFNVLAIYYLTKVMGLENITIDHVYTCYKETNRPVPISLKQSLFDTSSSRYGYIDIKDNNFSIPTRGENLVEHELPKASKEVK